MSAAAVPKVVQHHNHVDIQVEAAESGNRDIRSSDNLVVAEIRKRRWRGTTKQKMER